MEKRDFILGDFEISKFYEYAIIIVILFFLGANYIFKLLLRFKYVSFNFNFPFEYIFLILGLISFVIIVILGILKQNKIKTVLEIKNDGLVINTYKNKLFIKKIILEKNSIFKILSGTRPTRGLIYSISKTHLFILNNGVELHYTMNGEDISSLNDFLLSLGNSGIANITKVVRNEKKEKNESSEYLKVLLISIVAFILFIGITIFLTLMFLTK